MNFKKITVQEQDTKPAQEICITHEITKEGKMYYKVVLVDTSKPKGDNTKYITLGYCFNIYESQNIKDFKKALADVQSKNEVRKQVA